MDNQSKRIAFVSGASRGIGAEIARRLAADGYRVVCAARSVQAIDALAAEIDGLAIPVDVGDAASIEAAISEVETQWGTVDVLVNNAVASSAPFTRTTDEEWNRIIGINLTGGFASVGVPLAAWLTRMGSNHFCGQQCGIDGISVHQCILCVEAWGHRTDAGPASEYARSG